MMRLMRCSAKAEILDHRAGTPTWLFAQFPNQRCHHRHFDRPTAVLPCVPVADRRAGIVTAVHSTSALSRHRW